MTAAPRDTSATLGRVAVFAALIIVLGTVVVPLPGGVPITGQTLGVMLAGLILGPRIAPLSIALVLALAALGLPVLAGGRGGLGVFVGPTVGYMIGWIVGVVVIGLLMRTGRFTWWRTALAALVGGVAVVYAFGIPVQALVTGVPIDLTALSSLAFLPGDLIKVTAATLVAVALRRAYPRAFPDRRIPTTPVPA
ncbi:biotin transporter BioY [Microbacterium algeriense]|jgi:biotin transport system substrate-specific component|uniref:Biotin transporter n=1 Tax=Microbacterium algeriense TaxID=2615184 RepID=A0ABQ6V7W3_9MICO|nr:biotin transporter BioY [Microbacterium algeriense]KAB1866398.1 biotin transporter BioY [Microbacterium algeriense]